MATSDDTPTGLHGQPWSSWAERIGTVSPYDEPDVEEPKPKPATDAMRLSQKDAGLFGYCPERDTFYLIVCEMCGQIIKPRSLKHHMETSHRSILNPPAKCSEPAVLSEIKAKQRKNGSARSDKLKTRLPSTVSTATSDCILSSQQLPPPPPVSSSLPPPPPPPALNPPPLAPILPKSLTLPPKGQKAVPNHLNIQAQSPPVLLSHKNDPISSTSSVSMPTLTPSSPAAATVSPAPIPTGKRRLSKTERKSHSTKEREYDPDRHCGVWVADAHKQCTRSLTCKSHSLSHRRAVQGRSKNFDELLAEHKASRELLKASKTSGDTTRVTQAQVKHQVVTLASITSVVSKLPHSTSNKRISPSTSGDGSFHLTMPLELKVEIPESQPSLSTESVSGGGSLLRVSPRGVITSKPVALVDEEDERDQSVYFAQKPKPMAMCSFYARKMGNYLNTDRRASFVYNSFRTAVVNCESVSTTVEPVPQHNIVHTNVPAPAVTKAVSVMRQIAPLVDKSLSVPNGQIRTAAPAVRRPMPEAKHPAKRTKSTNHSLLSNLLAEPVQVSSATNHHVPLANNGLLGTHARLITTEGTPPTTRIYSQVAPKRTAGQTHNLIIPELGTSNLLAELPGGIKVEIAPSSLASLQASGFTTDQRTPATGLVAAAASKITMASQIKAATAATTVQMGPSQIAYLTSAIPTTISGPVTFQPVINQQVLSQLHLHSKSGVAATTSIPLKLLSQGQPLNIAAQRTMVLQHDTDKS